MSDSIWEKAYPIFEKFITNEMSNKQKNITKWNILQIILAYEAEDSLEELAKDQGEYYSHRFNYEKWLNDDKSQFRLRDRKEINSGQK